MVLAAPHPGDQAHRAGCLTSHVRLVCINGAGAPGIGIGPGIVQLGQARQAVERLGTQKRAAVFPWWPHVYWVLSPKMAVFSWFCGFSLRPVI